MGLLSEADGGLSWPPADTATSAKAKEASGTVRGVGGRAKMKRRAPMGVAKGLGEGVEFWDAGERSGEGSSRMGTPREGERGASDEGRGRGDGGRNGAASQSGNERYEIGKGRRKDGRDGAVGSQGSVGEDSLGGGEDVRGVQEQFAGRERPDRGEQSSRRMAKNGVRVTGVAEGGRERGVAAGQAFFISDGSPINTFEFLTPLVEAVGQNMPTSNLSVPMALVFGRFTESIYRTLLAPFLTSYWLPEPPILPAEVFKVGVNHYFSIKKANRLLGYSPVVSSAQGTEEMVRFWREVRLYSIDRPGPIPSIVIPIGIFLLFLAAWTPVPFMGPFEPVRELGILIFFSVKGLQTVWWFALVIHVVESTIAWVVARQAEPQNATAWFWQTMMFGFWSLRLLFHRTPDLIIRVNQGD
eukprot:TRINITY_DN3282_c0_g2_i1.p1 TRINITY_DN3282_c0_g2~~TRINITY_DN3282_c0_g2_i1.p1  ORF type:complete len:462 (+),score=76.20 TRINITY_DN3282_c0_g2_i1:149-1387(+)